MCRTHGGSTKNARQAAQLRMAVLVDPSIDILDKVVRQTGGGEVSIALKVRVAQDVLNRAGLKHVQGVDPTPDRFDPRDLSDEQLEAILSLREQLAQRPVRQE